MQRQRALADPSFAGANSHEMPHTGEPVGDARALLGHLLENSGSAVADDVVVALHCQPGAPPPRPPPPLPGPPPPGAA